jgi:hypothetical protein
MRAAPARSSVRRLVTLVLVTILATALGGALPAAANPVVQAASNPCGGSAYTGAYICIPPGYIYSTYNAPNLRFNRGAGLSGYG